MQAMETILQKRIILAYANANRSEKKVFWVLIKSLTIFTDILSFLVPAYTSPSPFWIRGRRKEEKRYKGEPLQKLARFWREVDHFHGNFSMNLAFSKKIPKFQVFFENSTKNPESFGGVEVIDDDTMTMIERKLFCILIKGIQTSQRNCGMSQKLREFR